MEEALSDNYQGVKSALKAEVAWMREEAGQLGPNASRLSSRVQEGLAHNKKLADQLTKLEEVLPENGQPFTPQQPVLTR